MFDANDRVLVYPFDRESISIIKSTENYPNIRISRLVSPESWGHKGEFYKCAEGVIEVSHDYESELEDCSTVWIVDSWNELGFNQYIEPAVRLASEKGKRIVCSRYLSLTEKESLSNIEMSYVEYLSSPLKLSRNDRVQEIRTPVIFIMSSTEYCNQFYIETAICTELRNQEYSVLLISSEKEGVVFGEYVVPDFMFHSEYSENEKVLCLNRYVRQLETKHQPDVIVIGVPGVAMPYHNQFSTDYAVLAYEVSEAIKSDFAILSSPCMPYDSNYFSGVEKSLYGRLGVSVDVHSLSCYALDLADSSIEKCLSYLTVDDSYVQETIERIGYDNLLNLNNMAGITSAIVRLVDKLSESAGSLMT